LRESQIKSPQINSEGQVVIKNKWRLGSQALSIILDYDKFDDEHVLMKILQEILHTLTHIIPSEGDVLYGIDVFIKKNTEDYVLVEDYMIIEKNLQKKKLKLKR
jgi:hypothetical protein